MAQDNDDTTSRNTTKLFSGRIDSSSVVQCGPQAGYSRYEEFVVFVVARAVGGGSPQVAADYTHGPDGANQTSYDTVISATAVSVGDVLDGSTDTATNGHFGDVLECTIAVTVSGWVLVDVYEVRKTF